MDKLSNLRVAISHANLLVPLKPRISRFWISKKEGKLVCDIAMIWNLKVYLPIVMKSRWDSFGEPHPIPNLKVRARK